MNIFTAYWLIIRVYHHAFIKPTILYVHLGTAQVLDKLVKSLRYIILLNIL